MKQEAPLNENMPKQLTLEDYLARQPEFNGPDYEPSYDKQRLTGQLKRIFDLVKDSQWRTLREIEDCTNDPPASISAQLRHLRKPRFGGFVVEKRHRGDRHNGLFEYRLLTRLGESQ